MGEQVDTDAAGILIGNGCDVATAIAASIEDQPRESKRQGLSIVVLIGVIIGGLWLLW